MKYFYFMLQMKGLTLQELEDLYDASTEEMQKYMLENIHLLRTDNE